MSRVQAYSETERKILKKYPEMSVLHREIAEYILKNKSAVVDMNSRTLGETLKCGASSIVRFSEMLGFSGFSELKFQLSQELSQVPENDLLLNRYDGTDTVCSKALQYAVFSLTGTVADIDEVALSKAAKAVAGANRVLFSATGGAAGIALTAVSHLIGFGIHAEYVPDELMNVRAAASLQKGDVVIAINYLNRAKSVLDTLKTAEKCGATRILIASDEEGPLTGLADILFKTPLRRIDNNLNFSTSSLCQLMVIQLIICRLWQLFPERFDKETKRIQTYTDLKML